MSVTRESTMATSASPMWMENLSEWILDEGRIVSAKSLSRELKVNVNTAKERLFHFAEVNKGKELEVILLLAGKSKDGGGGMEVKLVRRAEAEGRLSALTSKHVYAVAKKSVLERGGDTLMMASLLEATRTGGGARARAGAAITNK